LKPGQIFKKANLATLVYIAAHL